MTLYDLMIKQLHNQIHAYGVAPDLLDDAERTEFIKTNALAAQAEVIELLDEHGWKNWSKDYTTRFPSKEAAAGEAADVLCFLFNILLANNVNGDELETAYLEKVKRNAERQKQGYDVSKAAWKCKGCGRALDDPGVLCTEEWCRA
jgi:dimeric dUTPase (all-alpha-NTP-PPase superfamily)